MYLGSWKIDDLLTFTVNTHSPTTGAETDADSAPTYRVYEDETTTPILTGSMALLDDANTVGHYSEQITLSAANGFEEGKTYTVRIRGVVGGVAGSTLRTFQMRAEVNAVLADAAHGGTSASLRLGSAGATPALYVTNSGGDAVVFESSSGRGFLCEGTTYGLLALGGTGMSGQGSNGHGVYWISTGGNGDGIRTLGNGTGDGTHFEGGATGDGAHFNSGAGVPIRGNITGDITGNLSGTIGSLAAQAKADVNAEADTAIVDAALATAANLATVDTVVDAIKLKTDLLPEGPAKNAAFTYVVKMVDATDGFTPETGLTVTMTRSLDGAAFAAATGTVTEISSGHYKVVASAADMNGDVVAHRFTATGAADHTVVIQTTA